MRLQKDDDEFSKITADDVRAGFIRMKRII